MILIENQGCCRVGIRRKDLTKKDPPVYVAANKTDDQKWTLCTGTFSEFLLAALAYEAIFAFPFCREELVYWLTEEELETVQSGLEKQPFGLHGWLEMDLSFIAMLLTIWLSLWIAAIWKCFVEQPVRKDMKN